MADVENLKKKISDIIDNFSGVKLFFFVKKDNQIQTLESKVKNDALTKLKEGIILRLKEDVIENEELSTPLLSNADERKNALYLFDYDEKDHPEEFDWLKQAKLAPPDNQKFYNVSDDFSDIHAMAIVLYGNNSSIALYKHKYNLTILKQTPKALNLFGYRDGLEEIKSDVLKIDFGFELLLIDDEFYVKNIRTLETSMRFHEVITKSSNAAIELIKEIDILEDCQYIEKRSKEIAFARKLAKISKHSPVLGKVDVADIIRFAGKHEYLSTKLITNEDGDKFIVKTRAEQKYFIKLLSDDYLDSELTELKYESLAKDILE